MCYRETSRERGNRASSKPLAEDVQLRRGLVTRRVGRAHADRTLSSRRAPRATHVRLREDARGPDARARRTRRRLRATKLRARLEERTAKVPLDRVVVAIRVEHRQHGANRDRTIFDHL